MAKRRDWQNLQDRERGARSWHDEQHIARAGRALATDEWAEKHRAKAQRRPPVACKLTCLACGHGGNALARPGQRFVCSACGAKRIKVTY